MGASKALMAAVPVAFLVAAVLASTAPDATPSNADLPPARQVVLWGELRDLPPGTLVLDAPSRSYSAAEVEGVRDFLDRGGRLAVIAPSPAAESLLRAVDAGIQPSSADAFDPDVDGTGRFLAQGTGSLGITGDVRLEASRIVDGDGEALVVTAPFTWRDADRDQVPDLGEARGSWALARLRVAEGRTVLVLGTQDLLLAEPTASPLAAWLAEQPPLLVDGSHRQTPDPLGARPVLSGHRDGGVGVALLLVAAAGIAVTFRLKVLRVVARRRRPPLDPQTLELVAELEP